MLRCRAILHLNPRDFYPLLPLSFSLKLRFCTTASDSFTVSYLINNVGFSRETALKASKRLRLKNPEKPDSVLAFFRNRGFSDSDIRHMVRKEPWLLTSHPPKWISPKLDFFLSKGASASDIARMLTASPKILRRSLEKHILPLYEFFKRFLKSDEDTIACIIRYTNSISYEVTVSNLKMMIDHGVCDSSISRMLLRRPSLLGSTKLLESLEEVKGLGFDPSKSTFGVALVAKRTVCKSRWDEKVDTFKKWGWSDETVLQAFRLQPNVMLVSTDKIDEFLGESFGLGLLGTYQRTNTFWVKFGEKYHSKGLSCAISSEERFAKREC